MNGCCSHGIEGADDICIYLIQHEDNTTSCKLLLADKISPESIGIGVGCVLKIIPKIYNYYKEVYYGEIKHP